LLNTDKTAQLSDADGTGNNTVAEHKPGVLLTVTGPLQVITGFWLSITVTVNEQVPVLLLASVAVQFTVVVPTANILPLAGVQEMVEPGQLSEEDEA
jgi:hypothetical protein